MKPRDCFFFSLVRILIMSSEIPADYLNALLSQGQQNLNICPECFNKGGRKEWCTNMVVLMPEKVLVCCCLGNKHEVSRKEFRKKVRHLKSKK